MIYFRSLTGCVACLPCLLRYTNTNTQTKTFCHVFGIYISRRFFFFCIPFDSSNREKVKMENILNKKVFGLRFSYRQSATLSLSLSLSMSLISKFYSGSGGSLLFIIYSSFFQSLCHGVSVFGCISATGMYAFCELS